MFSYPLTRNPIPRPSHVAENSESEGGDRAAVVGATARVSCPIISDVLADNLRYRARMSQLMLNVLPDNPFGFGVRGSGLVRCRCRV